MNYIKNLSITSFFLLILCTASNGQSYNFGVRVGPSVGFQQWNGFDQNALFAYHGAVFIESFTEDSPSSLYAQVGYFTRGSAFRSFSFNGFSLSQGFKFNNLSLTVGAKNIFRDVGSTKAFYTVGIRGDYTLSTNLTEYDRFGSPFYPNDEFVNKINYGLSIGGGIQYQLSEFIGGSLEVTINPDVSKQYQQPQLDNIINPYTNQQTSINAREIRNLSIDISLSIRFLRKVEYY